MSKKFIFIFNSFIILILLILNTISANIQDEKSEILLNEIKRTQNYNTNIVTMNKFFAYANLFHETQNLSNYNNCDRPEYKDYGACKSLKLIDRIERSQNITEEMEYFYPDDSKINEMERFHFDDSIIEEIRKKDVLINLLNLIQYLFLGIAFLGQTSILLYAKEGNL